MRNTKSKKQNPSLFKDKYEQKGITPIALVITTIFSYDEFIKSSNNKGFLLATI